MFIRNDRNCVESVFKNGSDSSTILLLPEFVDIELDDIVDFIERLNEIKGFSISLDYLLENGIETKDYKQYKKYKISQFYQEYSSLFRLRCVTNVEEPTYGWFNKEIADVNYESNKKQTIKISEGHWISKVIREEWGYLKYIPLSLLGASVKLMNLTKRKINKF